MASFQAIFVTALIPLVAATVFSSSHKVQKMALQEDRILFQLKEYIDDEQPKPPKKVSDAYWQLLDEFERKPALDVGSDLKHPNGVYFAIKRFAVHYPKVMGGKFLDVLKRRLLLNEGSLAIADKEDFNGALAAFIRLQEIYNLSTSDMIEGNYRGHIGPPLAYEDAYSVGRVAFTMGKLNTSRDWLEQSLELRLRDPMMAANPRREPTVGAIKSLIGRVYIRLGNLKRAEELYGGAFKDDTKNGDVSTLKKELRTPPPVHRPLHPSNQQANFSRLCQYRGTYHIESPNYKAMKCRYKTTLVPYYVFKEEILSISPYVSLFYNVFTERDRTHLVKNTYGKLARSKTGTSNPNITDNRICDSAWLRDAKSTRTKHLSTRVSLITGLSIQHHPTRCVTKFPQSGEPFQVVNYGLAGHYDVHIDARNVSDASGFRVATFLAYLNTVEEGGNTVFTQAGISVAPDKDTVLFWYSFSPAFDKVDNLTYHAGCPVMVGEKWIATKWIRSHGNDNYRPCGLKPDYTQLDIEKVMANRQRIMFTK